MRVLLVNPPSRGIYYRVGLKLPPLGLGYLAAVLRKQNHEVCVIDLNVEPEALKSIDWKNWDLVGISGDTSRQKAALEIARLVKAQSNCKVVMGGYHATFEDEECLANGDVDYVVRGEGEGAFLTLVNCLEAKDDPQRVPGISYQKDGLLWRTADTPPVADLEYLPLPARDLLPMKKYRFAHLQGRPLTTLVTSRGCPYNCSFCSSSQFAGRRWRKRSPQAIVDEIEHVVKNYGYQAVAFMDDNFTLDPRRVIAVCREIRRRGLDVFWWCFSRVETVAKNEFLVEEMVKAGAKMVFLGLESASEAVLKSYGKGFTVDIAARAVELLRKYGIRVWGSFIIGGLEETKEAIKETIAYARWLNPDIAEFSILTPFPGTKLFQKAKEEALIATYNWDLYDGAHAVMNTPHLTRREIAKETILAYVRFYGRWSRLGQIGAVLKDYFASSFAKA